MISKRIVVPMSVVTLALLAGACDDATTKEQKAEQTQAQADQQKATAEKQASDKTAAAWDAAAQQMDQAQAKADRAWDAASSAMTDEKNDYASKVKTVIDDIDSKLTDIRASSEARDASASQRNLSNEVATNMDKRRAALVADQSSLEKATSEAWPALRLKIDTDLNESKSYMRTASSRLSGSHR